MLYEFYLHEYKWDLGNRIELDVGGEKIDILEAEAELYRFLSDGVKIKLVCAHGVTVGFLFYHLIYDTFLVVRAMFTDKSLRGARVGAGFINLFPKVRRLIYATYKHGNQEFWSRIRNSKVVSEDQDYIYWEAEWGKQ